MLQKMTTIAVTVKYQTQVTKDTTMLCTDVQDFLQHNVHVFQSTGIHFALYRTVLLNPVVINKLKPTSLLKLSYSGCSLIILDSI